MFFYFSPRWGKVGEQEETMPYSIRDYQQKNIDDIRNELKNYKNILSVLPCGAGKAVIAAEIARLVTDRNNTVMFLVHRRELCLQIKKTFEEHGVNMDLCKIGMVQTLTKRIKQMGKFGLIIVDEAHHTLAQSYINILNEQQTYVVGFTATPVRLKEGGLGRIYQSIVTGPTANWLIENNYLSPARCISIPVADMSGVKVTRGD